jgi:hypothetical protein
MHENHLVNQPCPQRLIIPVFGLAENDTEFITEVLQTLIGSFERVHFEASQEKFHAIRQEGIVVILHHYAFKDFLVGSIDKAFQDKHDRHDVLLLSPAET